MRLEGNGGIEVGEQHHVGARHARERELGQRVPDDVSVATLSRTQQPGWAGIDQQERMVGARAIELLISIFQAGERGVPDTPLRLLVEGKWFDGDTVRAVGEPQPELLVALE